MAPPPQTTSNTVTFGQSNGVKLKEGESDQLMESRECAMAHRVGSLLLEYAKTGYPVDVD